MITWLPIDSAPKDGTEILLANSTEAAMGEWDHNDYAMRPRPYWRTVCGDKVRDRAQNWTHWSPINLPETEQ